MTIVHKVVGIDPSLTGTAVCIAGSEPVVCSSVNLGEDSAKRIERYVGLVTQVVKQIPPESYIFIEAYSFGSNDRSASWLREYGGILRLTLLAGVAIIVEVSPAQLKKFATGKGKGGKEIVAAHVAKRWGKIFDTTDETDAFVLAQIGLCYTGQVEPDNQAQREVIETLKTGGVKKKRKAKKESA